MFIFLSHVETSVGNKNKHLDYDTTNYFIIKLRGRYLNVFVALGSASHTEAVIHKCLLLIFFLSLNFSIS